MVTIELKTLLPKNVPTKRVYHRTTLKGRTIHIKLGEKNIMSMQAVELVEMQ